MKVDILKKEDGTPKINYPCLMKHTRLNLVVLFKQHGVGMAVKPSNSFIPFTAKFDEWDMREFEPFTDGVLLTND